MCLKGNLYIHIFSVKLHATFFFVFYKCGRTALKCAFCQTGFLHLFFKVILDRAVAFLSLFSLIDDLNASDCLCCGSGLLDELNKLKYIKTIVHPFTHPPRVTCHKRVSLEYILETPNYLLPLY